MVTQTTSAKPGAFNKHKAVTHVKLPQENSLNQPNIWRQTKKAVQSFLHDKSDSEMLA